MSTYYTKWEYSKWEVGIPSIFPSKNYVKNHQVNFFNDIDQKAVITDFAILLGGNVCNYIFKDNNSDLGNRCGIYWLKHFSHSHYNHNYMYTVIPAGSHYVKKATNSTIGTRIMLQFNRFACYDDRKYQGEVFLGFYPQTAPSKEIQFELEKAYVNDLLNKTKVNYNVPDSFIKQIIENNNYINMISDLKLDTYEYNKKMYIKVPVYYDVLLSNNEEYHHGDNVWIEVEPIKWLIDSEESYRPVMISDKILFAGVPYLKNYINISTLDFKEELEDVISNDEDISRMTEQELKKYSFTREKNEIFYNKESEINIFIKEKWFEDIMKVKELEPKIFYKILIGLNYYPYDNDNQKNGNNKLEKRKLLSLFRR